MWDSLGIDVWETCPKSEKANILGLHRTSHLFHQSPCIYYIAQMEKTLLTWKDHRDLLYLCKGHWDSESLSALAEVTQLVNCRSGSAVQISELAVHALLAPYPTKDWLYYTALYHLHKDGYCLSCLDGRFARIHPNAHSLDAMLPVASICEHCRREARVWGMSWHQAYAWAPLKLLVSLVSISSL